MKFIYNMLSHLLPFECVDMYRTSCHKAIMVITGIACCTKITQIPTNR